VGRLAILAADVAGNGELHRLLLPMRWMKDAISVCSTCLTKVRATVVERDGYPAQQDSIITSLSKVWAQSLMPSASVR
jgi:hypothetical protein